MIGLDDGHPGSEEKEWEDETEGGEKGGKERTREMDEKQRRMRKGEGTMKIKTSAKG